MADDAHAAGSVNQTVLASPFDELRNVLSGDSSIDDHDERRVCQHDHRSEIALEAVVELRIKRLRDRVGGADIHEGVSVRRGLGDHGSSKVAAGARTVVNYDGLAPTFRELLPD